MNHINRSRRHFLQSSGALALGSTLPISLVELAFADAQQNLTFAYISDAHIQQIKGSRFVRNWDRGLIRAVAETNLLNPKPDFVMFGGDLAQLGSMPELDHGAEILSVLKYKTRYVMGEHDYYLDLGAYWEKLFGSQYYSFDHKGVHFIVLNSIRTYDDWTYHRWPTAEQRMLEMAGLDNPNGSPFMVGDEQRQWLKKDLAKIPKTTPIVVFSHSPLQKIYKGWNFWTEDAEQIQALLKPFNKVSVIYGHVHQIQYNQIGNISFHSVMATAWPWPYPSTYAQAEQYLPKLTVPMNRADPFFERDATGWQFINVANGHVDLNYLLPENTDRSVGFDKAAKKPVDAEYQSEGARIPPQSHF
ncbi:metallophosphoesterase [Methylomicrobium sp. Wu6]|uniref:metallophosphoesterase family protein n=1 Tax=Methylomicrobium sp. Wu6 TaxID=3107928 RepID=UPI002DD6B71D|nr:metallophosphoesterase [Methylomicrobium sp. Wu6]MEC4747087.1 metallophosphoesterase [Methylomicrobium sp. Wu6]